MSTAPLHPSVEAYENVRIWSRCTFLSLVAAYGAATFQGWFQLLALGITLLTVGLAITTLVKMVKTSFPFFSILLMIMIILWSLFLGFSAVTQLIFADAVGSYYECLQQATTQVRSEQCTSQMSDNLFNQILGGK
ncbi:MAG: hypothetical protein Q3965_00365 [Rothia sp. (in: high G+C Gram-positive bacteria)]|nr:hypothetical protein [Rothia sp. (in: high G+C Gram-positive bacteria)]